MKAKAMFSILLGLVFLLWACKDEKTFQGKHDPEVIKTYHNSVTNVPKMDSLASVHYITKQKLTEIYELSSLFTLNEKDSLMREILLPQLESYFLENDSTNIQNILQEMNALKVNFVEISNLKLTSTEDLALDSVRTVDYQVDYYSENKKLIDSFEKRAHYILKKEPKKFKHEFVFYFTDLETLNDSIQAVNDTISLGETQ
ncbi:MAG TPA: hypothetical protein VL022_03990 [Moheibacter sp.]|nr:hypothetical protein [Moheibacter sp.]